MKNKVRQDYVKTLRLVSIAQIAVLVAGVAISFLSGDIENFGFFFFLGSLVVFVLLLMLQYKLMEKCRCRYCGHVEVFDMAGRLVVTGVKKRCPKCNRKLNENEIVG